NKTVREYNKSVGSLEKRLSPSVRRFRELGISTSEPNILETIEEQVELPKIIEDRPSDDT
ncbi:DNA recombination protein RmuC, partial [Candidatus Parcubacteria bacterium]